MWSIITKGVFAIVVRIVVLTGCIENAYNRMKSQGVLEPKWEVNVSFELGTDAANLRKIDETVKLHSSVSCWSTKSEAFWVEADLWLLYHGP